MKNISKDSDTEISNIKETRITLAWLLSEGTVKTIFEHVRNLLTCAFLVVLGVYVNEHKELIANDYNIAGFTILGVAFLLLCMNFIVAIRKLKKLEYHHVLISALIVIYIVVALRIVFIAIAFRSSLVN